MKKMRFYVSTGISFPKLVSPHNISRKIQIIESFPIPRAKEDILEFLLLFKPKASDPYDPCNKAYLAKYQECLDKSTVYFPGDPIFLPFIDGLPSLLSGLKKGAFKRWINRHKLLVIFCVIAFFYLVLLVITAVVSF